MRNIIFFKTRKIICFSDRQKSFSKYLCTPISKKGMKKLFLCGLLLLSLLVSCSKDSDTDGPTPGTTSYRHTLIIYMSAQNSLGYQGASYMDSVEIARGSMSLKSTSDNILFYLDDAQKPRIYRLYKKDANNAYIQKVKQFDTDLDSSDPATLTTVLNFAATNYSSKSYGLVLWSHGLGWLPDIADLYSETARSKSFYSTQSFGVDVGEGGDMSQDLNAQGKLGRQMGIDELASAIETSKVHPTYVFFDACLMQCTEVAYALRNATDYIIGSPAVTSGYGIYYADMIPNGFFAYPFTQDSISKMVDTYYYDVMENTSTKRYYSGTGCIMSAIKTSEMENLAKATAIVLPYAVKNGQSPDMTDVCHYNNFAKTSYPHFYDAACAMKQLLPDSLYQTWRQQLNKAVVYKVGSPTFYDYDVNGHIYTTNLDQDNYCALSLFIPQDTYTLYYQLNHNYGNLNKLFQSTQWYTAAKWSQTGW